MANNKDIKRPSRIRKLCKTIAEKYGKLQKRIMEKSKECGYARDVFDQAGEKFKEVPDNPIFIGVEETLKKHFEYMQQQEQEHYSLFGTTSVSGTAFSTASTASTSAYFVINPQMVSLNPPFDRYSEAKTKEYSAKLSKLNPELGRIHGSVWETFYGTAEAPEKNALYAMRQTFDQLFRIIAPDEEVRKSEYFIPKKSPKEKNQVYRIERLKYAANSKVKNKKLADLLTSQAKQTLEVYDKLNKLHSGHKLDRTQAREILASMSSILEGWIDAVVT
jgi:hypothetical protein